MEEDEDLSPQQIKLESTGILTAVLGFEKECVYVFRSLCSQAFEYGFFHRCP